MIQFDELLLFATHFIKTLLVQYENVREMQESNPAPVSNSKKSDWTAKAKALKAKVEAQEKKSAAFKEAVDQYMATASSDEDKRECKLLTEQWGFLQASIEKEKTELKRILSALSNSVEKPKVKLNMDQFFRKKVEDAFAKYDANGDGVLQEFEARDFIVEHCKFEFGKIPSE